MFIDCSKFEKVLKADYKSWGVKFGLTKKGMYILHGTGWIIEANASYVNKEFLGTAIKVCGPAPKPGEFIKYQKGSSPQHEMELESGEGMIRIAFLIIHLDIKYHKN